MAVLPDPFLIFPKAVCMGTRLGDHNISDVTLEKLFVDASLDGPYANQVHVSVYIYFHWLLLL